MVEVTNKLKLSEYNLEKSTTILEATKETEQRLLMEANELMKKLEISIVDKNEFHDLLAQSREVDIERKVGTIILNETLDSID